MYQDSESLSPDQVLGVIRRRLPLIALCVALVAGAAFGLSRHQTKKYTATASLAFSYSSLSQQIAGLSASSGSSLLAQQTSNLELVRLGDMAAKTAAVLGHGLTEEKVADSVSVGGHAESNVVGVSATATSPALAAAIANTYVTQFVKEQQRANREYFKSALKLVDKQLAALSRQQRVGSDGLQLQNRAQTLSLLAELNYGNVQVAQEALTPTSPSSPRTSRNIALGAFLGLVLGLALAFVLERFDRRIRRPEDLEAIYRRPSLGAVPKSAVLARSARDKEGKPAALPPTEAEAFSLIRAHLRFFNVDRDLRTLLIASAGPGEGKTTIARHLAETAARSGSRVLLVEMDLRHPTLAQQLDIQSGPGLTDVLVGALPIDAATQTVRLATARSDAARTDASRDRTLDVLTAGAVAPPNPAELLESYALDGLLERAKSTYDLVVIDTPPLTVVSDAFPLLSKVDGVVVIGWVGRSRRDSAEHLHQVLASSGAPLLGVLANGSKSASPSIYSPLGDRTPLPAVASANGASPSEGLLPTTHA